MTSVTRTGDGVYLVDIDGRQEIVYVAGPPDDGWAFWNGQVFRDRDSRGEALPGRSAVRDARQSLAAPMPATVMRVLVTPGQVVTKGETLVILEAMKMELPLRSAADATVTAVHCQAGQIVQADTILVELS